MNAGIVKVEPQLILNFLQFGDGGRIQSIEYNIHSRTIDFVIEHPDMPELANSDPYPVVMPLYTSYEDQMGHKVALREKFKI